MLCSDHPPQLGLVSGRPLEKRRSPLTACFLNPVVFEEENCTTMFTFHFVTSMHQELSNNIRDHVIFRWNHVSQPRSSRAREWDIYLRGRVQTKLTVPHEMSSYLKWAAWRHAWTCGSSGVFASGKGVEEKDGCCIVSSHAYDNIIESDVLRRMSYSGW